MIIGPARERLDRDRQAQAIEQHREPETGAPIPRIVSPAAAAPGDSLRWTDVPQAEGYRVRIWDEDGRVVWTSETRSTAVILPAQLHPGLQYMWDVSARTGWDRWVSSDLAELTLRTP